MREILKTIILSFFLVVLWLPTAGFAGDDLHSITEKASTNKLFERAIEFFTVKVPEMFEKRLYNSGKYIDQITEIFSEKGIPLDLAYLPLIESGFSPLSVGRGDTVGLWQFVKGTARKYGLRIDTYVDERKDPLKSTHAAAEYLRDLYASFGAWDIALAAYNAGEGRIKSIFRKSGTGQLPHVSNRYLANFMAASVVAQNPLEYGLESQEEYRSADAAGFREITTHKTISLKKLAADFNTTVPDIKALNPALLKETTPPYTYVIRLPEISG